MTPARASVPLLLVLAACGADDSAPLTASDVSVFAPPPGQEAVAAYLTLHNNSSTPLLIARVTSPEFAQVQMHAMLSGDGMAVMTPLDAITVAEDSEVEFAAGTRHLMLTEPMQSLAPGDEVTLEFHYGGDRSLVVQAPLQPRLPADE
ncbi:MAG TPA: copper chaperone PCu(A)C [Woeseiaceae bacterium]|nr:copper chaperone PCu(A)C [Woeseiaceae bacterium]